MAVLRPHLALTVTDVERSIPFYEALFGTAAGEAQARLREVLGRRAGAQLHAHPGRALRARRVQPRRHPGRRRTDDVLAAKERLVAAGLAAFDEMDTTCCYARQDKIWVRDPDGTPWEVFVTHEDTEQHGDGGLAVAEARPSAAAAARLGCGCASRRVLLRVSDRAPAQRPADALPALGGLAVVAVRGRPRRPTSEQWRGARRRAARADPLRAVLADGRRGAHHDEVLRAGRRARQRGGGDVPRHPAGRRGAPHAVLRALPGRGRRRRRPTIAAHVERAREQVSDAFRQIFDVALVEAHEQLVAAPGDLAAKVRFVTLYHLVLEGTLGLTSFKFITDYLERERPAAGLRRGLLEDPPRRDAPHRLRRLVPARDGARAPRAGRRRARRRCASCCPHVAESLKLPGDGDASSRARRLRGRPARSSRSTA